MLAFNNPSCYNIIVIQSGLSPPRLGLKLPFLGETSNIEVSEAILVSHPPKYSQECYRTFKYPKPQADIAYWIYCKKRSGRSVRWAKESGVPFCAKNMELLTSCSKSVEVEIRRTLFLAVPQCPSSGF